MLRSVIYYCVINHNTPAQIKCLFFRPNANDLARILLFELVLEKSHIALYVVAPILEIGQRRLEGFDGNLFRRNFKTGTTVVRWDEKLTENSIYKINVNVYLCINHRLQVKVYTRRH